jgi:hypothetical protein
MGSGCSRDDSVKPASAADAPADNPDAAAAAAAEKSGKSSKQQKKVKETKEQQEARLREEAVAKRKALEEAELKRIEDAKHRTPGEEENRVYTGPMGKDGLPANPPIAAELLQPEPEEPVAEPVFSLPPVPSLLELPECPALPDLAPVPPLGGAAPASGKEAPIGNGQVLINGDIKSVHASTELSTELVAQPVQ